MARCGSAPVAERTENVVYDYKGTVFCVCPETGKQREMCNGGFEKGRNTLKRLCPAKQSGAECKGAASCPGSERHPHSDVGGFFGFSICRYLIFMSRNLFFMILFNDLEIVTRKKDIANSST